MGRMARFSFATATEPVDQQHDAGGQNGEQHQKQGFVSLSFHAERLIHQHLCFISITFTHYPWYAKCALIPNRALSLGLGILILMPMFFMHGRQGCHCPPFELGWNATPWVRILHWSARE